LLQNSRIMTKRLLAESATFERDGKRQGADAKKPARPPRPLRGLRLIYVALKCLLLLLKDGLNLLDFVIRISQKFCDLGAQSSICVGMKRG
jgi:hypothetical protein